MKTATKAKQTAKVKRVKMTSPEVSSAPRFALCISLFGGNVCGVVVAQPYSFSAAALDTLNRMRKHHGRVL